MKKADLSPQTSSRSALWRALPLLCLPVAAANPPAATILLPQLWTRPVPLNFRCPKTVTFTGMTSFPVGSEPEPNNRTIFKRLEEQTNVHIDWTAIQSDQWSDKITLNMSNPNTLTDFRF